MQHSDFVCPACACVCDDLTVVTDDDGIREVRGGCRIADAWFARNAASPTHAALVEGVPTAIESALAVAADLLTGADYPLVYGLSRSSTAGQRAAIELAELLGGVVDTTASLCHGPSIVALQNVGEVTCTLGEVRNRSDLVIFWGCDPAGTHPRHAERYSVLPRGRYVPRGRADRTVVLVGDRREVGIWRIDEAGTQPDLVVPIDPGRQFEALATLRMLVEGRSVAAVDPHVVGADLSHLRVLADLMTSCRHGIVFFGLGLVGTSIDFPVESDGSGQANVESLLRLVADLNGRTRFFVRRMRLVGDVSGADTVLCWQTGHPFAVDLARGYPRYNPGEFSAIDLLRRNDVDACLIVGSETVKAFPRDAREHLARIPTVVLDYPSEPLDFVPTVRVATACYGLHAPGTIYRMDGVPLPLRACLSSAAPTDEHVLRRLIGLVASRSDDDGLRIGGRTSIVSRS